MKSLAKEVLRLIEGKQVGVLYHYTTLLSLLKIVASNTLGRGEKYDTVSVTRNKNFHKKNSIVPTEGVFVLDGNKLSNKYKIEPFAYTSKTAGFGYEKGKYWAIQDQQEEIINTPVIQPLKQYVKEIVLFELDIDSLIFDEDFLQEASLILGIQWDNIGMKDIISFIQKKGFSIRLVKDTL